MLLLCAQVHSLFSVFGQILGIEGPTPDPANWNPSTGAPRRRTAATVFFADREDAIIAWATFADPLTNLWAHKVWHVPHCVVLLLDGRKQLEWYAHGSLDPVQNVLCSRLYRYVNLLVLRIPPHQFEYVDLDLSRLH